MNGTIRVLYAVTVMALVIGTASASMTDIEACNQGTPDQRILGCTALINGEGVIINRRNVAGAHVNRGIAYAAKGELDRALSDFDRAIQLKPDMAEAYANRGNVYLAMKQYDKALADYTRAIELKPDYVEAYTGRAMTYAALGQNDLAKADQDRARQFAPRSR